MKENCVTSSAYLWTRILAAPFWGIFNILPYILLKDLGATYWHVALVVTLKPVVSIFSIYWSAAIARRPHLLIPNIVLASLIGHVPFFLCPFVDSLWFFIGIFALYMMLARGVMPAWMELLKRNVAPVIREKVCAYGSMYGYLGATVFCVGFGWLLDHYHQAWRWVFPVAAAFSFAAIIFQLRVPIKEFSREKSKDHRLIQPWVQAWTLLRRRPDFSLFQIGFMLGGGGVMIMQPALPFFFEEVLGLSYTGLALSYTFCKGIGYALTTPKWAKLMNQIDLYRFSAIVTLFAGFFALILCCAQIHLLWLYVAYFVYGVMQAGSEMSWHLSGPLFAKGEDSIAYTNVNILSVGVRGIFAPALGGWLSYYTGPVPVILLGGCLCFLATERMLAVKRKLPAVVKLRD